MSQKIHSSVRHRIYHKCIGQVYHTLNFISSYFMKIIPWRNPQNDQSSNLANIDKSMSNYFQNVKQSLEKHHRYQTLKVNRFALRRFTLFFICEYDISTKFPKVDR
ncbi:unnamed protein product [Spodoptera littoralis]|uniref:Uncharacterized protein n=1 Tax=Spodoptera littoralis TaxID=7109 RepID=A0A9P0IAV0_SPOLI|nr:unnamed protein product [Spodoptera littoralis]CAH1643330.1 unnamed protein product [Spodoptera littoralis]